MAFRRWLGVGMAMGCLAWAASPGRAAGMAEFAHFDGRQVTGIAVSKAGRVFVNFPHWDEFHDLSVAELLPDGRLKPFPYEWDQDGVSTQAAGAPLANGFFCVQSVVCDDQDTLWIVDAASPGMKGVVNNQAKLVAVDLARNQSRRVYAFNAEVAPPKSYLNDVRVDPARHTAYLSDSGLGAIVVVDLETGGARRLLEKDPSTHGEPGFRLSVLGEELTGPDGKPPEIHCDGIELSPDRNYLYYHALTARTLYRIETAALRDATLTEAQLAAKVEKVAETGPVDGLGLDRAGNLYLSYLEDGAVRRLPLATPGAAVETVVKDPALMWPDSFACGPDGTMYVSCSQIENSVRFHKGKSVRATPYRIFKLLP
jgi:sugar lactone lactonase YvrE